jgi:hypothetical protein
LWRRPRPTLGCGAKEEEEEEVIELVTKCLRNMFTINYISEQ